MKVRTSTGRRAMSKQLYYRISPANDGIVFAKPERATFIDRIHRAFEESKTWGDFRKTMPAEEYRYVMEETFGELGEPEGIPSDNESFNPDAINMYLERCYPSWLQQEMDAVLPDKLVEEFAEELSTMWQGDYLYFEEGFLPELLEKLQSLGYELIEREDLRSW